MRIDGERLRQDFDALARIGATPAGGLNRPSFSAEHLAARAWFTQQATAAGLQTRVDAAGNHSAILPASGAPDAPTLLLGSHLDSVPDGGRFDGALGVVCALHVLMTIREAGIALPVTLEAIDFTDEEGTLVGLLGSQALAGTLEPESLRAPRGGRAALVAGLERAQLPEDRLTTAARPRETLAGYLELHIEQGPRLEQEGVPIGVVSGIFGVRSFTLTFRGLGRHAGTTPMDMRRDAGLGAAAFMLGVQEIAVRDFPDCVATVGDVALEPGVFNVVPGVARVALEFRALDAAELAQMEQALLSFAEREAASRDLELEIAPAASWAPTDLDAGLRETITAAATDLGLRSRPLPSGAVHDAQALAAVVPSAMIFVPSAGGVSHHPDEYTPWADCVAGADVLLAATLAASRRLAG